MADLGLELHDAGLTVVAEAPGGAAIVAESPGFALLEGGTLRLGTEAERRARRAPRHLHSRFWQELDTEPLPSPFGADWSAADLAHAQLERLWREAGGGDRAWLAVSSAFSKRQLDVAFGVARAAGVPASGAIDAAVAAAAGAPLAGAVLHLDLHLHRLVGTRLAVGAEVERGAVATSDRVGLEPLRDRWARRIADALVRATRFDPFHDGPTEQQLYDRLAGWLADARRDGAVAVSFERPDGERAVELREADLEAAVEPLYGAVEELARRLAGDGEPVTIALPQRCAELPGLARRLAAAGFAVEALPAGAAAAGALRAGPDLAAIGGLRFVTRLGGGRGAA